MRRDHQNLRYAKRAYPKKICWGRGVDGNECSERSPGTCKWGLTGRDFGVRSSSLAVSLYECEISCLIVK